MLYFKKDYKNNENTSGILCLSDSDKKNDENRRVRTRTLNFMLSSALVLCVLHPLDTIRTRKQIYRVYKNSYPYYYNNKYNLFYILKKEKLESIYRGLLASLITTGASHGLFRFIYDTLNCYLFQRLNDANSASSGKTICSSSPNHSIKGLPPSVLYTTNITDHVEVDKEREKGRKKKAHPCENLTLLGINKTGENGKPANNELANKREINNEENMPHTIDNGAADKNKNMNYYIITSSVSSIISVFFLHPVWLVKTKIECTINLNYKFLNYKNRITSRHYKIFVSRNKFFSGIFKLFTMSNKNYRNEKNFNSSKVRLINENLFKLHRNNFIYNKNMKTKKKYNYLTYIKDKNLLSNNLVKRKMVHNYVVYKYYTLSILEKRQMTKNVMKHLRKKFYTRYILYSINPLSNNTILHLYRREEIKNSLCAIYRYKNYFHFIYNIYKKEKLLSFYKGFFASLLLTPHVAIQFYTYECLTHYFTDQYIKNALSERNIDISSNSLCKTLPFVYGVISKYIAIVLTYPLYTIKMRQQVQMKNYGFYKVLVNIFKLEGIKSYYTGINMHLLRNCLQNGTLFFIFEYLNKAKI
ncbi:mitochondrial carrier protein, putative [Plasmodium ovale]|uniref:Mitochondrial carrier protein, putative n=1 Tax=Plasmodium ovale TaxID=36330 RepID=A0A1C3L517_PLAOA|nr:mitochondrial carrier protein, putative [Plasmodium ovale]